MAEIYAPQVSGYAEFWADLRVTRPARGEVLVAWCCHEVGMLAIIRLGEQETHLADSRGRGSDGNVEVLRSRCTERILEFRGLHCFNSSGDNGFILCSSLKGNFFVQRLRGMKAMLETRGQQRDSPSRGQ